MEDALYHLNVSWISRGDGRSAVAAAAYRSAQRLINDAAGKFSDFRHKAQRTLHSEIVLPAGSPSWSNNRAAFWNRLEQAEKRKDARLAVEIEFAVPYGVPRHLWERLARQMAQQYAEDGYAVDFSLHTSDDGENPHVHMMLPMRRLTEDGFAKKKNIKMGQRAFVYKARQLWSKIGNAWLSKAGSRMRLDHRSYRDRGLDRDPTRHRGIDRAERTAKREVGREKQKEFYMDRPSNEERKNYPLLSSRDEWPPRSEPTHDMTFDERIELREYQHEQRIKENNLQRQKQHQLETRTHKDAEKVMSSLSKDDGRQNITPEERERDVSKLRDQFFSEDRNSKDGTERILEEKASRSNAERYREFSELEQKFDRAFKDPERAKENLARDIDDIGTGRTLKRLEISPGRYAETRGSILTSKGREERRDAKEALRAIPDKLDEVRTARDEAKRDAAALERYRQENRDDRDER